MILWIKCLFLGHDWETRTYPKDAVLDHRAFWEDWQVCLRCGKDTRETWEIQDDNLIRMERIEMEMRKRKL
jgi:hypothetical protein